MIQLYPTEDQVCATFVADLRWHQAYRKFDGFFHKNDNEGKRSKWKGIVANLGLLPGLLDYTVICPSSSHRMAYIEFKGWHWSKTKQKYVLGVLSPKQKDFIVMCESYGIPAKCFDADSKAAVEWLKEIGIIRP